MNLSMAKQKHFNQCSASISVCAGTSSSRHHCVSSLTSFATTNVKLNPLHRGWQRFLGFLFPSESDTWLAVFRIGLGLQVTLYALFLRNDWHYLFASSGKGLVGRELC